MERTLARFVHALRNAEVAVTPAETLDAVAVVNQIGVRDRSLLKHALSLTLAKNVVDKHRFDTCFDDFFDQLAFAEAPQRTLLDSFDHDALLAQAEPQLDTDAMQIMRMVLADARTTLALRVQQMAARANVHELHALRDKALASEIIAGGMGVPQIAALGGSLGGELATGADYVRHYVNAQIRQYVDRQYELNAHIPARRAILDAAVRGNLANVSPQYQQDIDQAVTELAEALRHKYKQRSRKRRRGQLDIRHMLRNNVAYDGRFFDLAWRARKRQQGTVYVLCDVSGSVARLSRFLLLLLHNLNNLLPNVRSFAFSNELGEVTHHFAQHNAARAAEEVLFRWGNGTTDYGRALADFRALAGPKLNHRATVIIVGDGRNNFYDPRADVLKSISARARQVLWLNPEGRDSWGEGDSEMRRYAPFCLHVARLATLDDLKRFAERLINAR